MFGMKYSIDFTNKFKKSLKKSVKRGLDPNLVLEAVSTLEETGCLPKSYKPHKLHGNYEGVWECHITADWLMTWLTVNLHYFFWILEHIATCSKIQQIIENEIP